MKRDQGESIRSKLRSFGGCCNKQSIVITVDKSEEETKYKNKNTKWGNDVRKIHINSLNNFLP